MSHNSHNNSSQTLASYFKGTLLRRALAALPLLVLLVFAFQNCSGVNLQPISHIYSSHSCPEFYYNIVRQAEVVNGHTTYFIQENSYDITSEYANAIDWYVNGQFQSENPFEDNRLHLNCETHPEEIEVRAEFLTNCNELQPS